MGVVHLKKIYLASPRGFCAGVTRAVAILDEVLKKYGAPIYVRNQIIHNQRLINDYEKKGVIFIKDLKEVPDKSILILSAHGTPRSIYKDAQTKRLKVYDAACPLVTKVHLEAIRYANEGYFIFYIGKKNHPESIGVLSEVDVNHIRLIETVEEADNVIPSSNKKLVVLNQTTLCLDDTQTIISSLKKRFPNLILPPTFDICYSTQNRQLAVKALAKKADLILVVGSKNSSNSKSLQLIAEKNGAKAYLIDAISQINIQWFTNVDQIGITAGASAPNYLIDEVIKYFSQPALKIEEVIAVKEKNKFTLPQI